MYQSATDDGETVYLDVTSSKPSSSKPLTTAALVTVAVMGCIYVGTSGLLDSASSATIEHMQVSGVLPVHNTIMASKKPHSRFVERTTMRPVSQVQAVPKKLEDTEVDPEPLARTFQDREAEAEAERDSSNMPFYAVAGSIAMLSMVGAHYANSQYKANKAKKIRARNTKVLGLGSYGTKKSAMNARSTAMHAVPDNWANEPELDSLLQANKRWAYETGQKNPDLFENLKVHNPDVLWIGCSDARVPPVQILDLDPGAVFVHRNVANLVVNTDMNFQSVLQYAVNYLKVNHIVVCGHYDCGGIKAALTKNDHDAPLQNWLGNIKDVRRLHREELASLGSIEAQQRRLVEWNTVEQCLNLYKSPIVQKRRIETYEDLMKTNQENLPFAAPRIHAMVYEPTTGLLHRLNVDFMKEFEDQLDVYTLYEATDPTRPYPPRGAQQNLINPSAQTYTNTNAPAGPREIIQGNRGVLKDIIPEEGVSGQWLNGRYVQE